MKRRSNPERYFQTMAQARQYAADLRRDGYKAIARRKKGGGPTGLNYIAYDTGRRKNPAPGFPTDRWVNVEKVKLSRNGTLKQVVIRDSQMPGSLKKAIARKKK